MLTQSSTRLTVLAALVVAVAGFSTSRADNYPLKRRVAPYHVLTEIPEGTDANVIVLKLREGAGRPLLDGRRFVSPGASFEKLNDMLSVRSEVLTVQPRIKMDVAKLDGMRAEGSRRVGWQLPDLSLYFEIHLSKNMSNSDRIDLVNRLNDLDPVEIAYFGPIVKVLEAPDDEDVSVPETVTETPDFESGQYHLQPAPVGFNAYYAWQFPGGRGEGIKITDIESNWNETHEDLHGGTDHFLIAGEPYGTMDHGTAVLGIIAADSNSFGMTGIAHNVELGTSSWYAQTSAEAVLNAAYNAEAGDIINIEGGPSVGYYQAPLEYNQEEFDAILTASALGRVVTEASGNSNVDLGDTQIFDSVFYPEYRFSGAIMVGSACADHVPDIRTNYGIRMDVHAFGCMDIYTLGYGYLYGTDSNNYYTSRFSGTSSAAAEIAGATAVVQGLYKAHTGSTLDHNGMRYMLTTFSTPQVEHEKLIGPMPDLAACCNEILGYTTPSAPGLVSPEHCATFEAPAQLVLDWEDVSATSYQVQIDDQWDFGSPLVDEEDLAVSQMYAPDLTAGAYFWRVRAANESGWGMWSEVRTILVDLTVQAPTLVSPEDNARFPSGDLPVPLQWNAVPGAQGYRVEVNVDEEFADTLYTYHVWYPADAGVCTYLFNWGKIHFNWRVKVLGDEWPWSEPRFCRVIGGGGNAKPASEAAPSTLLTNYPNPFNPITDIRFSLSQSGHVRLEIFNILGQKVTTLLDESLAAGQHTVVWDGGRQASGVYLFRLTTPEEVVSNKMLLLK